jgi:hypothetical protein
MRLRLSTHHNITVHLYCAAVCVSSSNIKHLHDSKIQSIKYSQVMSPAVEHTPLLSLLHARMINAHYVKNPVADCNCESKLCRFYPG